MVENDFVQTPEYVTKLLLDREVFSGNILEPCCGRGAISNILIGSGYEVVSSDKYDYGYGNQVDVYDITKEYDNVITNPPFTKQVRMCRHLLSIYRKKMALLWYVKNIGNVLEGAKSSVGLKTIYVINKRIDWVETKLGWLFGWYVWEKGYTGEVTIHRI